MHPGAVDLLYTRAKHVEITGLNLLDKEYGGYQQLEDAVGEAHRRHVAEPCVELCRRQVIFDKLAASIPKLGVLLTGR